MVDSLELAYPSCAAREGSENYNEKFFPTAGFDPKPDPADELFHYTSNQILCYAFKGKLYQYL